MSRPTQEAVEDNLITWQRAVYELHREIDKLDQENEILRRSAGIPDLDIDPMSLEDAVIEVTRRDDLNEPTEPTQLQIYARRISALEAALRITHQALIETAHAQSVGADWYTKGASGLYQQVAMWVRKGLDAIRKAHLDAPPRL